MLYGQFYRTILYPAFTALTGSKTLQYYRDVSASQWWSQQELEEQQLQRLNDLLLHCREHCRFYKTRWQCVNARDRFEVLDQLNALPLLRRQDVANNCRDLISTVSHNIHWSCTGGSTGEPVRFAIDQDCQQRRAAITLRGYEWANALMGQKWLYLWGVDLRNPPRRFSRQSIANVVKRRRLVGGFTVNDDVVDRFIRELNSFRPDIVVAYANMIYHVAQEIRDRNLRLRHNVRSVLTGAEKIYPHQRRLVEDVFQCALFETYGSRETLLIGSECDQHSGLHISSESMIVEIVDDDGKNVPAGTEGAVAITDLTNYAMPLVRYLNGDRAVKHDLPCPCGRGLPLLKEVTGRTADMLSTRNGGLVSGLFFPHLMKDYPSVMEAQLVQLKDLSYLLRLVSRAALLDSEVSNVREALQRVTGDNDVRLAVEYLSEIPRTEFGKLRVVIREC